MTTFKPEFRVQFGTYFIYSSSTFLSFVYHSCGTVSHKHALSLFVFFRGQDLSNLLVEEDKAEENISDVLSEVELLHKQASHSVN